MGSPKKSVHVIILTSTVILNIILFSTLVVLIALKQHKSSNEAGTLTEERKHSFTSEHTKNLEDTFCIDCQYFGQSVHPNDTIYDIIEETECGRRLCCIRNQRYLQSLMKKISLATNVNHYEGEVDQNTTESMLWWRQRQNSAHLYLNTSTLSSDKNLRWIKSDKFGTAYMNGVSLSGSKLRVEEQGYYFVYAALSFNFDSVATIDTFYQTVTREHPLLPNTGAQIMLMNKYGGSPDLDKHYTSFLCGTFFLQSGYEVDTRVSEKSFISRSPYASYFGMYKL